ncbi:MAG: hypothetical protein HUU21_07525 [Polyangiaceae bacterium]|nr:hypothetical protein [Polyangiaceae bacterium]
MLDNIEDVIAETFGGAWDEVERDAVRAELEDAIAALRGQGADAAAIALSCSHKNPMIFDITGFTEPSSERSR